MARIKISIPDRFLFSTIIPVRITDINYGGHVGNDALLSILHEARLQYLNHIGYSEMDFAGTGLIMADAAIEFKAEAFYGNQITAWVCADEIDRIGFDLYYKLEKQENNKTIAIAIAKTAMVCYDYQRKKPTTISVEAVSKLMG